MSAAGFPRWFPPEPSEFTTALEKAMDRLRDAAADRDRAEIAERTAITEAHRARVACQEARNAIDAILDAWRERQFR